MNLLLPMVVGNYLYHDPKLAEEEEQRSWIEVAEGEQGSWIVVVVEAEEEHPTFRMKEDVVVEEAAAKVVREAHEPNCLHWMVSIGSGPWPSSRCKAGGPSTCAFPLPAVRPSCSPSTRATAVSRSTDRR